MAEWNKKREAMRHYDSLAPLYDAQYAEEQDTKIKAAVSSMSLRKDSFMLDAGCGTGLLFKHVEESARLLVGLDISWRILKEAKKRAKSLLTVVIVRADADFAPFRKGVFDAIFAITLLQNTPDPLVTLHEMKRVSKDHAIVVATGLKKEFSREAFVKLLHRAGLEVSIVKTSGQLKDYVAVCRKVREEKPLKERFGSYKCEG